jgi:hypothetical protein
MIVQTLIFLILFKTSNAGEPQEPQQRNRIPNIWGANIKLGQLYDGRKDQLLDLELFTPKTVEENLQTGDVTSVKNDFKIYKSFLERINDINIKASLKLSFMGGLISVSGSAEYLHDEHLSENTVEATLTYKGLTNSFTLPKLAIDNDEYCALVSSDGALRPTHVVSEIIYGMNAYLQFTTTSSQTNTTKGIEGSLSAVVNSIPSFQLEGSAEVKIDEAEEKIKKNMKVKWHGDAGVEPPTTFEDAVAIYKDLDRLRVASKKVVKFSLSPITSPKYCTKAETILNSISENNINKVSEMQDQFHKTDYKIRGLMQSEVATGFNRYQDVFTVLNKEFTTFKNDIIYEKIAKILPKIRGNDVDNEDGLFEVIASYTKSPFNYPNMKTFLGVRKKELDIIAFVVNQAKRSSKIEINRGDSGDGVICRLDKQYTVRYILRVKPKENVAKEFIKTAPGGWDESKKWFTKEEDLDNSNIGRILSNFLAFHESNIDRTDLCFLISLEDEDEDMEAAQLKVIDRGSGSSQGQIITDNFVPPLKIDTIQSETRGYKTYQFDLRFEPNPFVTSVRAKLYKKSEGEDSSDAKPFSESLRYTNDSEVEIKFNDLQPNNLFAVTFQLMTDFGSGPASDEYLFQTLPSDTPSNVQTISITPNEVTVSWEEPETIAPNVTMDKYKWKLMQNHNEIKSGQVGAETNQMNTMIDWLLPAENYNFSVKATSSEELKEYRNNNLKIKTSIESEWATISFTTQPEKIQSLNLESTSETSLTVSWLPYDKIAEDSTFLHYKLNIKTISTDSLEYPILDVTAQTHRHQITGLIAGTKYMIRVAVITTKGSSPFSDILEINTDALEVTQLEKLKKSLGIDKIIQMIDEQEVEHGSRLLDLETRGSGSVWFHAFRTSHIDTSDWTTITYTNARRSI